MIGRGDPPIGVDLGATRVRMASMRRDASGSISIAAVAVRDVPGDAVFPESLREAELLAAILEDLWRELRVRNRRCVLALSASVAIVRVVRLPKMSAAERWRAVRFEAERFAPWDGKSVASRVRAHWMNRSEQMLTIGIAREDAIAQRVGCARRAGLRVVGIDHEALALHRAFPMADAILDIGHRQSRLHAFSPNGPVSIALREGGADMTRAIAMDLSVEPAAAEKRKRILGTAGAGDAARDAFVERVRLAVTNVRERIPIRRLAMVGNGARLAGLDAAIEFATDTIVETPVSELLKSDAYPADVARAAAPDWTLAAALAAWKTP